VTSALQEGEARTGATSSAASVASQMDRSDRGDRIMAAGLYGNKDAN
jgi:hypothetical protein